MMRVWSHRPQFLHLGIFIAAYVLGCGFAQLLAVVPGTGISIWPPGGLFMATLILASRPSWPWWVLGGFLAELFSNFLWFQSPFPAAVLIYAGNALEAAAGAWLVSRACGRPVRLETLQEVLAFVMLGAGIAPLMSATIGSATLAWFGMQSQTFTAAWPLWWIGDATGVLIVAPLALVALQNWRGKAHLSAARWMEASALGVIFLGVAALSLSGYLPFAYIMMPPLLWAAVRFEFKGAVVSLALLALIAAIFTISGVSQFAGDPEAQRDRQMMLQLFLAISAFSALIVAAISRQYQVAVVKLRQSERQLRQMIDALPVRIWSAAPSGKALYFNKRYQDHFRAVIPNFDPFQARRIEELAQELTHPEDAPEVQRTMRTCFETGNAAVMRFRWRENDSGYRWAECRVEPRRNQDGAIEEWYGVSLDIDDEMRAQQALRERERELSQLVDVVPAAISRHSANGELTFFNKRLTDFVGLDVADTDRPGMSRLAAVIETIVHPDDAAGLREALNRSFVTGESYSRRFRMRHADGVYRWMESRAEPMRDQDGAIVQWYAVSIDIDDEMRLYRDIEEREAKIRRLVDSDIIGIVIWDLDGQLIDANDAFLRMIQCDREDLEAGLRWFDMTPPEWQEVHARDEVEELKTTGKMQAREKEFFRKDGSRVPVLIGAACFEGQSRQGVAYILDLTERKRAEAAQMRVEEALRRSQLQFQQLVETLPVMIDCVTPDGEPVYRSQQLREFLGDEPEQLDGTGKPRLAGTVDAGVHADDLAEVKEQYAHSLATGQPYARKHRLRRFDGEYRWVETRAAPMRNAEEAIVQWNVICLDIESEVRAQEELRQAQASLARASQAASLAELSASIAHEVNQPLAAVVANSHACQRWLTAEPPNIERAKITAERIIRDANSAAGVVSHIRALFRQSIEARGSTMLDSVIAEARSLMAEEAIRRRIRMDVDVESGFPPVTLDRIQIQQVLINLIRNGMDAMESVAGDRVLGLRVRRMGDVAQIEISDRGRGIEAPDRIFEPFFTTKEDGMGMGLAVSRSIVEAHGGRLWVERNEPHGVTFAFTLPVEAKAVA